MFQDNAGGADGIGLRGEEARGGVVGCLFLFRRLAWCGGGGALKGGGLGGEWGSRAFGFLVVGGRFLLHASRRAGAFPMGTVRRRGFFLCAG